jgi:diguanylate cyclase (GGDEF)-like protein
MGFRLRLALFLVAMLVGVQVLTWALVYEATRRAVIEQGERQLSTAAAAFLRQLDDIARRMSDSVQVLSLDYPLRAAVAERDRGTVLSALRNHGRRVGAERMLLVALDGRVEADTLDAGGSTGEAFPFPDLLQAARDGSATAVVAIGSRAWWMVVVPVYAPQPIALIAAGMPLDDRLLARVQALSALPHHAELVAAAEDGGWTPLASSAPGVQLAPALLGGSAALPASARLVEVDGHEFVAVVRRVESAGGGRPIAAVLAYSLDAALAPLREVATRWLLLLAGGLAVGLLGALWIARGVARPVEALAAAARRVEAGDYSPPPAPRRRDELAQLATAFARMADAIAEREQRIRFQAEHDGVTGLPNRAAAEALLQRDLARAPTQPAALLMIGLARMPEVVKTVGHAIADRMMRASAARLGQLAEPRLLARAADSQLLLWMPGADRTEAIALALRVVEALGEPYREADFSAEPAPAVGIVLAPAHGAEASALLQHADVALFAAQRRIDPVVVYDPATDPHRPERLALMAELRDALEHGGLSLHYQPKLAIASRRITGAEALVRWDHPRRGVIAPDEFVRLAEETGNIQRLTRWALAAGIAQARQWLLEGRDLRLAINLSARDLEDATLPRRLAQLLALHDVPATRIVLEITESAVMGEGETVAQVLGQIAGQGVAIAVDDFGVGQSSLAYLRRLPVQELKIDRSFITGLGSDPENRTIVRSIVDLGHRLGYSVTSEGVESATDLHYLASIGCDHAQGFFIARPMEAAALRRLLDQPLPAAV